VALCFDEGERGHSAELFDRARHPLRVAQVTRQRR
jgi:hypothetical protein